MVIRKEDFPGRSIDSNRNCEILKKAVISHEVHLVKVNLVRTTLELEEGNNFRNFRNCDLLENQIVLCCDCDRYSKN